MKKFILKIRPSKLFIITFLSAVFLISVFPIFEDGLIYQFKYQDLDYHILRIEGIKNEFLQGSFPPYIHSTFLNGYGYGNGLFYPEVLLYFPALLSAIGLSISVAYKVFIFFITLLNLISSYFSIKYISKNRYISLCFTALFILCQYRLSNVFVRAAAGEYCAFVFIPIVVAGMYDFFNNDFKKAWILGLGFMGLFLTHTITFAIALVLMLTVLVIKWRYIFKNKALLLKLLKTTGAVILLTSFYWGPMLEQCFSGKFEFNEPWAAYFGIMPISVNRVFDNTYYASIGLPLLFLSIIRIFITKRSKQSLSARESNLFRLSDKLLIIGLVLVFMTTYLFPWSLLNDTPFNYIQFPWRLFSFASLFLSFVIATYIHLFIKGKQRSIALIAVFCITAYYAASFLNPMLSVKKYTDFDNSAETQANDYFQKPENTFAIGGYEWLPLGTDVSKLTEPNNAITEAGEKLPVIKNGTTVMFDTDSPSSFYDIPLLYYKGYKASLTDKNGNTHKLTVEKSPNNNLVRVFNNVKLSGKITVSYAKTVIQKISIGLTVLSLFTISFLWIRKKISQKSR
jgi:hypothetical protein